MVGNELNFIVFLKKTILLGVYVSYTHLTILYLTVFFVLFMHFNTGLN